MKNSNYVIAVSVVVVILGGCSAERAARLYPISEGGGAEGVLNAKFIASGTGHGDAEIQMPDGELLKGEFSIVRGGAIGFGGIIANAFGPRGSVSTMGSTVSRTVEGGSPGIATAIGQKGTTMQCEFYNDNWSGHGYGACHSSLGKYYRLQY